MPPVYTVARFLNKQQKKKKLFTFIACIVMNIIIVIWLGRESIKYMANSGKMT